MFVKINRSARIGALTFSLEFPRPMGVSLSDNHPEVDSEEREVDGKPQIRQRYDSAPYRIYEVVDGQLEVVFTTHGTPADNEIMRGLLSHLGRVRGRVLFWRARISLWLWRGSSYRDLGGRPYWVGQRSLERLRDLLNCEIMWTNYESTLSDN